MSRVFDVLQSPERRRSEMGIAQQYPQLRRPSPVRMLPQAHEESESVGATWGRARDIFRKRWRLSVVFAVLVLISTMLVTLLTRPVYEPIARIEVDPPGMELFSIEGRTSTVADREFVDTQAKNLESDELAITVIRKLNLDSEPDLTREGPISATMTAFFELIQRVPSLLWRHSQGGVRTTEANDALQLTTQQAKVLKRFKKRLKVDRDTASRLISISFASHDPNLAAAVTNALLTMFVERMYQTRHDAIMKSTEWLSRQLDDLRSNMERSNNELATFRVTSGITDLNQDRSTFTEQMAELSRQLALAQGERIELQSFLDKVSAGNLESLPQVQSNVVVQQLSQQLAQARTLYSQNLAVYGKNHPNSRSVENQIQELEAQVKLQRQVIVGQLQTSYAAARSRELLLSSKIKGTTSDLGQVAKYSTLKKQAEADAQLYNSLYARIKEAGIAEASKSSNIRIVDRARVLNTPTRPEPLTNLAFALAVALIGGVLLAIVWESVDTRLQSLDDIRRWTGLSSVSVLPVLELNSLLPNRQRFLLTGLVKANEDLRNVLLDTPGSVSAEAISGLRTAIMLSQPQQPHVLLVSSSLPGEGKTTVAAKLALAFSKRFSTCLVDADLRRPGLAEAFGLSPAIGLGEYLADSTALDDVIMAVSDMPKLALIPSSRSKGDPGYLVSSQKMHDLITQMRRRYEFVIIDAPPVLPYADARAIAPFVDGIVFVGRAGLVNREAMVRSLELLDEVHAAPILEIVLNAVTMDRNDYYRYGYK